jgi:uncharacterized protein (DUF2164 family)
MKRKWDVGSDAARKQCVDEVITCLEDHSDASLGLIAAEEVIDIVLQRLGPDIYNLGLAEAKKLIADKTADIDVELDMLRADN